MSKSEVKKYIHSLDRDAIEQLVMDLYSARKEAKEYLEYVIKPNDEGKLEEYKEVIRKEFFPKRGYAQMRFSVCRTAVSKFKSLDPAPDFLADLMLYIPECASKAMEQFGDINMCSYNSIYNNFIAAMKYIRANGLDDFFEDRIFDVRSFLDTYGYGYNNEV